MWLRERERDGRERNEQRDWINEERNGVLREIQC